MTNGTKAFALAVLIALLAGCGSVSSVGFAQAPFLPEGGLEFTEAEKAELTKIALQYPALFDKLQKHNNARAAERREFNAWNLSQRVKQWKTLGYAEGDISVMRKSLIEKYRLKEPDKPEG